MFLVEAEFKVHKERGKEQEGGQRESGPRLRGRRDSNTLAGATSASTGPRPAQGTRGDGVSGSLSRVPPGHGQHLRGSGSLLQIREGNLQSTDPSWSLLPSGPGPRHSPHTRTDGRPRPGLGQEGLASAPHISALSCGAP